MGENEPSYSSGVEKTMTGRSFYTNPRFWRWVVRIGGTALLVFFLTRLNLDPLKIWDDLRQANLWLVVLSILLVFPFIALKAWRWNLILKDLSIKLGFKTAFRLYAVGLSAGSFTPGQAGDAIKAFYLRDMGYPLGRGLVSVVLDRLFDVAVLILLAASGLLFLGADFAGELPVLVLLLGGTLAGLVALSLPAMRTRLLNIALRLLLARKASSNRTLQREEAEAEEKLRPVNFAPVFGATLLASALALFRIWLLALALGMNLNPLQVVAVSSLATVVSLIPVSVAGIGARDVALVAILDKLGYLHEKAISLSSFILLLNLVNLVAGYVIWKFQNEEDLEKNAG
ncbi:MAG: flippase-like domain-containing protein [Chloroflexi bacterium]|uniref:Flippase-like domain-containing protein n=1 Tax=Candidatus Chlorohelix allophototropha TaxID=3003348 RepID=A0A8T7M6I8_9CHLR|nr:flippase-like domain-containing protein [Chloroflexota bacterium]WJW69634.1 flippase-like domain-containing protein [Chloroflexota bacterium L227-S17]